MAAEKRCSKCKIVKAHSEFHRKHTAADGCHSHCKVCKSEYSRTEAGKANFKRYRQSEKGKANARRVKQSEKSKEYDREYEKRDYVRARRRKYSSSPAGKSSVSRYRKSGKGKETLRKYESQGLGLAIKNRNSTIRRTRKSEAGGSYTDREWYLLCEFYEFRCLKCLVQFPFEKLEFDHIKPVSKGGTSYIYNAQPLCGRCNREKAASEIDYRETLPDWVDRDGPVWIQDKLL